MAQAPPTEPRDAHCKVYTEKSLKEQIQKLADDNDLSFSEMGRLLWKQALACQTQ